MEGRKKVWFALALIAGLAVAGGAQAYGPGMHPDDVMVHLEQHRDGSYVETWQTPEGFVYYKRCDSPWGHCEWFIM